MKSFFTFILMVFFKSLAFGAGESRVTEVSVFKDRAYVKRHQILHLEKGPNSIVFNGITPLADVDSLKVTLREKSTVRVLGIRNEKKFQLESRNKQLESYREEAVLLAQKQSRILEKSESLSHEAQNLGLLSEHYSDSFSLNLHQNTWTKSGFKSFMDLWGQRSLFANSTWSKLFAEFEENFKKIEMVKNKIEELSTPSDKLTLSVYIEVVASEKVDANVDLNYLVGNTGWLPTYDLRVDSKNGKAILEQHAYVWQNSGEDWTGVQLNLSNFRAPLNTNPPEIYPATLNYREAKAVQTSVASKSEDASELSIATANSSDSSTEGEQALSKTFEISGRHTVKDSPKRIKLFVAKKEVPYKEHLELVSAQYLKVFRKGELLNQFSWNLAEGALYVYYNGSYLNQTWLAAVPQGKPININAGVEHNLVVTTWENKKSRNPTALSSTKHFEKEIHTQIESFDDKPRQIRVMQQIPVSEIDAVKVEFESPKEQDQLKKDADNIGWYYWDVSILPRKSKTLSINLDVATPTAFNFQW